MSSFQFYGKIKGKKQGAFKGESKRESRTDWFEGVALRYKSFVPTEATQGVAAGRVRHEPVVVTKDWGECSPQILQAMWDDEVLDEVVFEFVEADGLGNPEAVYETITLRKATVVSVERHTDKLRANAAEGEAATRELEDVGFKFEEIVVKNVRGKTVAQFSRG
ncbi:MAG: type VI secretion system tube protein Hcp [Myxococcales bacterium]|nr:type VI secretion system tube protein Hcp [Myxococcales bacterium]